VKWIMKKLSKGNPCSIVWWGVGELVREGKLW
jgi:hypothetical protein